MKGLEQNKRRYAGRRETQANLSMWMAIAAGRNQIKHIFREDLQSGEISGVTRSKMNTEIGFFLWDTFQPLKKRKHALPQSLVWEELETGAILFTARAKFWIENARETPQPPVAPPAPKTKLCKSGACNEYGNPAVKNDLCIDCYERAKAEWIFEADFLSGNA